MADQLDDAADHLLQALEKVRAAGAADDEEQARRLAQWAIDHAKEAITILEKVR